jgi:putative molybdopterin biosynthesis protein
VAHQYALGFIPIQEEHFDFVLPRARRNRPAVQRFLAVLSDETVRARLRAHGFVL